MCPWRTAGQRLQAVFPTSTAGTGLWWNFPPDLLSQVPEEHRAALLGVLSQDPQPSYQQDPQRVYGMAFAGLQIKFTVEGESLHVRQVLPP